MSSMFSIFSREILLQAVSCLVSDTENLAHVQGFWEHQYLKRTRKPTNGLPENKKRRNTKTSLCLSGNKRLCTQVTGDSCLAGKRCRNRQENIAWCLQRWCNLDSGLQWNRGVQRRCVLFFTTLKYEVSLLPRSLPLVAAEAR